MYSGWRQARLVVAKVCVCVCVCVWCMPRWILVMKSHYCELLVYYVRTYTTTLRVSKGGKSEGRKGRITRLPGL